MIVGQPGSGKSTLARALGEITGLPVYHMDHIHYGPNWQPRDPAVKDWMTREVHRQPRWIFEGGHSRTYRERLARADLVIWLDLPIGLRLWRVIWRQIRYVGRARPDLPPGCVERLDRQALAFFAWIWRTRQSGRRGIAAYLHPGREDQRLVHLRTRREVKAWLSRCKAGPHPAAPEAATAPCAPPPPAAAHPGEAGAGGAAG